MITIGLGDSLVDTIYTGKVEHRGIRLTASDTVDVGVWTISGLSFITLAF